MEELYAQLAEITAPIDPLWIIGGIVALLLLIILVITINRSQKRAKARENAPALQVSNWQIAPLGRDASFKIINQGEVAFIDHLQFKNHYDIQIKNWLKGQQLDNAKSTRLLLESKPQTRIAKDLTLEIDYRDRLGNQYRQSFPLAENAVVKNPKLLRYG
ncbi:MAG: hypothetical protein AB8G22_20355 [Saprospiraceae bacterium]